MTPSAEYTAEDTAVIFTLENIDKSKLSSDGTTTGPSPYLIESTNGTYEDRDKPAPLNLESSMGVLRGYITQLQDDINIYLTERIKSAGNAGQDDDLMNNEDGDEEDNNEA